MVSKSTKPMIVESECERRDEIISLARYGKITPEEAEAEAAAKGWKPFAFEPELPAFDPMQESRWSIAMAIAWIAWRDLGRVRQNSLKFSSECRHWIFREWNEPSNSGTEFSLRAGWFLETWLEPTVLKLKMQENWLKRGSDLPPTTRLTIAQAREKLWQALGDERLVAEALDVNGRPVDVAAREWGYLKLFEEGKRDSLKYDAIDRVSPFTELKLKREDLFDLWPAVAAMTATPVSGPIERAMIDKLAEGDDAGYVPFCMAVHWIMTDCGTRTVSLDDAGAWETATSQLLPLIHSEKIEMIGLPSDRKLSQKIPGHALATIKILSPTNSDVMDLLLNKPSHIDCSMYVSEEAWKRDFNDKLYLTGQPTAAWSHLQLRKSEVLRHWRRPDPTIRSETDCLKWLIAEIRKSPQVRPKSREAFLAEAKRRSPHLSNGQFYRAWNKAIAEERAAAWKKPGPTPRSDRRAK